MGVCRESKALLITSASIPLIFIIIVIVSPKEVTDSMDTTLPLIYAMIVVVLSYTLSAIIQKIRKQRSLIAVNQTQDLTNNSDIATAVPINVLVVSPPSQNIYPSAPELPNDSPPPYDDCLPPKYDDLIMQYISSMRSELREEWIL